MTSVARTLLLVTVLSCTYGCSFFQLDSEDLVVPPPKPEAAAGKAAEGTAGMETTGAGGMSASGTGGDANATGGMPSAGSGN